MFYDIASKDRVPAITEERADLVIATFSITPERMKAIDFAGPYAHTKQGFLVRKDGPPLNSLADLNGKRICTWEGTTSLDELRNSYKQLDVESFPDAGACIDALNSNKADAASTDQLILYGFAQHNPGLAVVPDLTIGPDNYYGVGIARSHRADCEKLVEAIRSYITSSRWVDDFKARFPDIPTTDPHWESRFKPDPADLDKYSCREQPAP